MYGGTAARDLADANVWIQEGARAIWKLLRPGMTMTRAKSPLPLVFWCLVVMILAASTYVSAITLLQDLENPETSQAQSLTAEAQLAGAVENGLPASDYREQLEELVASAAACAAGKLLLADMRQ